MDSPSFLGHLSLVMLFVRKHYAFWRKRRHEITDREVCVWNRRLGVCFFCVMPGPARYSVAFKEPNVEPSLSEITIRNESTIGGDCG